MNLLITYGATERFINEATLYENLMLARVVAQYKGMYKIVTEKEECFGEISGKLRFETHMLSQYPAVGDFVMVSKEENDERAIIHNILNRKSVFSRTAVGISGQTQVIASNIDYGFICMSLNNNYNLSRLERYLSIIWDSGATPVIILTKTDLCNNLDEIINEVERVSAFSDIITTSMFDNNIKEKMNKYFENGKSVAFIGSSGVGKSTLINILLGEEVLETKEIGKAQKGKHTTTGREMFPCPLGGVVIDTPGMRELGAESIDVSTSFHDIEEFAENCKFHDCSHENEPGCAVLDALEKGLIDKRRLENYFKLKKEADYEGLSSKEIEEKKLERMFKDVGGMKNSKKFIKEKNKNKNRL